MTTRNTTRAVLAVLLAMTLGGCDKNNDDTEDTTVDTTVDTSLDPLDDTLGDTAIDGEDDPVDDVVDAPPDGCGFAPGGGFVSVTPGSALTLDTLSETAMNTLDIEQQAQIGAPAHGLLRYGPCGDARILMRAVVGSDVRLVIVDPTTGTSPETVDDTLDGTYARAALFMDGGCTPLVVHVSSSGFVEYVPAGGGTWTPTSVVTDWSTVTTTAPSSISMLASHEGADGLFHVFVQAVVSSENRLLHASRDAAASSAWSFEDLPMPEWSQLYGMWVDGAGSIHSLYRNTEYPCDPCNVDTNHGVLASEGTSWTVTVVHEGKWGDPYDEFVESASMAFDAADNPYIAAHWTERVITGSYRDTDLVIYGLGTDSEWCVETAITDSDEYAGSDGITFTGADPQLLIDADGRFHVLFRDQAVWHATGMQNEMRGQLRHAVRAGGTWSVTTLLAQEGQTESGSPLLGLGAPVFALSADGTEVVAAASLHSWETDSIYNSSDVPVTHTAQAVTATIVFPD